MNPDPLERLKDDFSRLRRALALTVVGQEAVVEQLLTALLARGHALLVGVPGLAKTLLVSTLAQALDLAFSRVQFTPDLMPSDVTGTDILQEDPVNRERRFVFARGPVFANVLLADEVNRTPPKTQAALLQAMQEGPPRTPSSRKAPTPCPKPNWTGSSCRSTSPTRPRRKSAKSWSARPALPWTPRRKS